MDVVDVTHQGKHNNTSAIWKKNILLKIFQQLMPEKLNADATPNYDVVNKAKNTTLLTYIKTTTIVMEIFNDLQSNFKSLKNIPISLGK